MTYSVLLFAQVLLTVTGTSLTLGCEADGTQCNVNATCVQSGAIKCCECKQDYNGNGLNCLLTDDIKYYAVPAMSKLSGSILISNKEYTFDNFDTLFASGYMILNLTGSNASEVGRALTQLYPITGGALGWTFALEQEASIGYDITGGNWEATTELTYSPSGDRLTVMQQSRMDSAGNWTINTQVNGSIPAVQAAEGRNLYEAFSPKYNAVLTRKTAGLMKLEAISKYRLLPAAPGNGTEERSVAISQTITYNRDACAAQSLLTDAGEPRIIRLESSYLGSSWLQKTEQLGMKRLVKADLDECDLNTCKNEGICVDKLLGTSCDCLPAYTGALCETEINECNSNPCKNGGTCEDLLAGYQCNCKGSDRGTNCDETSSGNDVAYEVHIMLFALFGIYCLSF